MTTEFAHIGQDLAGSLAALLAGGPMDAKALAFAAGKLAVRRVYETEWGARATVLLVHTGTVQVRLVRASGDPIGLDAVDLVFFAGEDALPADIGADGWRVRVPDGALPLVDRVAVLSMAIDLRLRAVHPAVAPLPH